MGSIRPAAIKSPHVVGDRLLVKAELKRLGAQIERLKWVRENGPLQERAMARARLVEVRAERNKLDCLLIQAGILDPREEAEEESEVA